MNARRGEGTSVFPGSQRLHEHKDSILKTCIAYSPHFHIWMIGNNVQAAKFYWHVSEGNSDASHSWFMDYPVLLCAFKIDCLWNSASIVMPKRLFFCLFSPSWKTYRDFAGLLFQLPRKLWFRVLSVSLVREAC